MRNAKNSSYILLLQEEIEAEKKKAYEKGYADAREKFEKREEAVEQPKPRKNRAKVKKETETLDVRFAVVEDLSTTAEVETEDE